MSTKDTTAAFPRPMGVLDPGAEGMSLRDWFASQALARYTPEYCGGNDISYEEMATCCYRIADAMIKERAWK